tara:strand:+ start:4553 stop:4735 length:183 start_codon:yes stop_codon:yes gene_type:complete
MWQALIFSISLIGISYALGMYMGMKFQTVIDLEKMEAEKKKMKINADNVKRQKIANVRSR